LLTRLVVLAIHCLSCSALPSSSVSNARPLRHSIALTCLSLSCLCVCLLILSACLCLSAQTLLDPHPRLGDLRIGHLSSDPLSSDPLRSASLDRSTDPLRSASLDRTPLAWVHSHRVPSARSPGSAPPRLVPPARPSSSHSPGSTPLGSFPWLDPLGPARPNLTYGLSKTRPLLVLQTSATPVLGRFGRSVLRASTGA
jgi:hypothetical protein